MFSRFLNILTCFLVQSIVRGPTMRFRMLMRALTWVGGDVATDSLVRGLWFNTKGGDCV